LLQIIALQETDDGIHANPTQQLATYTTNTIGYEAMQ
jgi:hypothetical protein